MAELLGEPGAYKWTKLFSISINRAGAPATTRLLDLTSPRLPLLENNEITVQYARFHRAFSRVINVFGALLFK